MGAVIKINLFLASRVEQLFQYDKDEGPLVVFPAEKGTAPQPTTKERKEQQPKAKQTRFTTKGRKVKPGAQPGEPSRPGEPNKRRQLEALLAGEVLTWGMLGSKVISRRTSSPSGVRPVGCIWSKQNLSQFLLARLNTHANIGSLLGPTLVNTNPINL